MDNLSSPPTSSRHLRKRTGIGIALLGLLIFLLGARPELFGVDRSPVIGFIQIEVFLAGLGARLVGTGYVIALASGMADVFGLGTRPLPSVPFFGYWQGFGVLAGQIVMIIGFVMMSPFWAGFDLKKLFARRRKKQSPKKKKSLLK